MKILFFFFIGLSLVGKNKIFAKQLAEEFTSVISHIDTPKKIMYRSVFKNEYKGVGLYEESTYFYGDKPEEIAVKEVVFYPKKDDELNYQYDIHHKQLKEVWSVKVGPKKVVFTKKRTDIPENKQEKDIEEEKRPDNFVIGPTILTYLQKNWPAVLKGKKILVRFAVLGRSETVGFSLFREESKEEEHQKSWSTVLGGKKIIVLKMRPTNFFISLLVDPLYMDITVDGKKMLKVVGRTLPRKFNGEKWKDMDAVTVFKY